MESYKLKTCTDVCNNCFLRGSNCSTKFYTIERYNILKIKALSYKKYIPELDIPDTGIKKDEGKLKWHLLPKILLVPVVKVLMMGAEKYAEWNWTKLEDKKRLIDAIDRHLLEYIYNKKEDDESGINHLAHIICNCLFLIYFDSDPKIKENINGRKNL